MPRRINLVAKAERVRTATNVPALAVMVAAVVVVFALALGYFLLSSERSSAQEQLAQLQNTRAALERQIQELDKYKQLATQVSEREDVVRGVYAGRTLVSQVISDLSRALPENVWITAMTVTAGDPQEKAAEDGAAAGTIISGTGSLSLQGNTYSFPDVALLLVRLKLVPALKGITLSSAGEPIGNVDPTKHVRGFSLTAPVVNTQSVDTPLPMSRVEVEGL
jgi:Tfp pilus assembly protein PilN